jgi:uncharacterized damage-inducible protein DinB
VNWPDIQKLHGNVVADFAAAAAAIPPDRWLAPRAEGKWSPAEVVEHITLAYDTLLRELEGGGGMKIRTKMWQRVLLRFTLVPKLLRGKPFPSGARAPRETRPASANPDQTAAVARFRERAARFDALTSEAIAAGRRVRLTHAYFGRSALPEAVLLCARHTQHHLGQLIAVA